MDGVKAVRSKTIIIGMGMGMGRIVVLIIIILPIIVAIWGLVAIRIC